ncbi:MAG: archaeal proteasome endopeptidase complex subunit beta [Desulfurococcaceae archaeon]|nr:archaeal proteasome endopeptidase complex subunit beta [Desulfurococcaceae archaeon]MCC6060543.1 archaeal proteasome endopeptidase complex subunit beta [Desulfurococcaceae archaeon]
MAYEEVFRATVVGLKSRDGVVMATDRRLSYGNIVLSRAAKKIFVVDERAAVAFAGLYGDVSGLVRFLQADISAYKLIANAPVTIRSIARRLSVLMYSYKWFPFFVETLVGGVESDGTPRLYVLDPLGSILEEDYTAVGSGATIAFGFLENNYSSNVTVEEAEKIALSAVRTAIGRDIGSGDGIDIVTITRNGARERSVTLRIVES